MLHSSFDSFNFNQHFFLFPISVEDAVDAHVLSNLISNFLNGEGSSVFIKFNKHVPLVVLWNFDFVLLVVFVDEEPHLVVAFNTTCVGVYFHIHEFFDGLFILEQSRWIWMIRIIKLLIDDQSYLR